MIAKLDEPLIVQAKDFFESDTYRVPSREDTEYMTNFIQFMGTSRKVLEQILRPHLESIEPILEKDKVEFVVDAHGQTTTNEQGLLTGHSGGTLTQTGIERARGFFKPEDAAQVIITSDTTRAIHHAIEKYFPDQANGLSDLIAQTPSTLNQNNGLISRDTQLGWIDYALNLGIIPTPLLRAQFYGPMELFPTDGLRKKVEKLFKTPLQDLDATELKKAMDEHKATLDPFYRKHSTRLSQLGLDSTQIEQELDQLREALSRRIDPKYSMTDASGRQITEQRADLSKRTDYFMNLISPEGPLNSQVLGKKIQIVSHSGTNDALFEYLRRYERPEEIHLLKRRKPNPRGESNIVTMDVPGRQAISSITPSEDYDRELSWVPRKFRKPKITAFRYLNDPAPLEDAIERTSIEVAAFRQTSPDEKIRAGNGVMPTEFYTLRERHGRNDEKVPINLDDILSDNSPYLVLGNCGLGKTTFSLDLANRLSPDGELNADEKYVPILVRLRGVKDKLDEATKESKESRYELLKGILTSGISQLDPRTIETYRSQGKQFVFILDGYDELDPSLKDISTMKHLMNDISKIGKIVMTSRYEQFSQYEDRNTGLGYARTINIDPDAIVRHLPNYLEARIEDETDRKKLGEFITKQSDDIKENWLMVYFITDIYRREPESINLEGEISQPEIMKKGIEWYIWDHAYRRNSSLFSPPVKNPGDTDESYQSRYKTHLTERKDAYIREVKPTLRKIFTYMFTVKREPVISADEVQMIIDGKWDLAYENLQRNAAGQKG